MDGKQLAVGVQSGMEKKGLLGAPGDPEVRQRRYPCLRQEFHFIGSAKTGTGRAVQRV